MVTDTAVVALAESAGIKRHEKAVDPPLAA